MGQGAALLYDLLLGIFSGPNRTKMPFEYQRSLYLVNLGATRRPSRGSNDLVERILGVGCQEAAFFVFVTSSPPSNGAETVRCTEPQLRWSRYILGNARRN